MIAAMHFRALLFSLGLAVALLSNAAPARAQFYDLDGVYHCLTKDHAACPGEADVPPPRPLQSTPTRPKLQSVFVDIRTGRVSKSDLRLLESDAAKREPHAVEALAWCKLNGLGGPAEPVAAYFLYGEAARLGVPHARANQVAIFETRLSNAQRQEVLMKLQVR